jgi:CheY-like chemotaxis protein/HPt (histidine-containing phosphotransfer) domain-containing protein
MSGVDAEFLALFRQEADERLDSMADTLRAVESGRGGPDALESLFRDAHTIKGGAGMLGLDDARMLAHAVEDLLDCVRAAGELPLQLTDPLLRAVDALRRQVGGDGEGAPELLDELAARRADVVGGTPAPAAAGKRPDAPRRASTGPRTGEGRAGARLVIADDSATILALVALAVKKAGYEAATASSGEEALRLARELRPELVIVDAQMSGMSGYDVCRALREDVDAPRPHVIILTAGNTEADRALAAEAGVDEFITKPFSPKALRTRVREILDES